MGTEHTPSFFFLFFNLTSESSALSTPLPFPFSDEIGKPHKEALLEGTPSVVRSSSLNHHFSQSREENRILKSQRVEGNGGQRDRAG
tara:strand:- start:495 stop:755 length:261 start_codon:yes stop_codon:yes gene_type:complete